MLSSRISKFKEKLQFIKLPTSMLFFVWLSSFTWVALASSYSLNCTYHRWLFTSRWQAKCCILIVLHLFMNISYGAYCMLCCSENAFIPHLLLKIRIFSGFQSDPIISNMMIHSWADDQKFTYCKEVSYFATEL